MNNFSEQFQYIEGQLVYIKSKVQLNSQLGLYDINKLGEDLFLHILNDAYGWNLENANSILQSNFPAIDLIDKSEKIVIQVTSTTTAKKLRNTIEKLEQLDDYSSYKLKMFYINEKPNFTTSKEEFESKGIYDEDLLGIEDILEKVKSNPEICDKVYKTLKQRLDNISFKFNINTYFDNAEKHLNNLTTNKFKNYEEDFKKFIESENKVLEIFAIGGNGKSHLLKYFASITTEYIPLIFTKQINIEEDLAKLDHNKKYLFIFDDIDRFLDVNILISLLSFIETRNIKLIISYRTASKTIVKEYLQRYNSIREQEIEIKWTNSEINDLILLLDNNKSPVQIEKLIHTFNNNPYLITQAVKGDIDSIKRFSEKIIVDTQKILKSFDMRDVEIENFLFKLSLLTPINKKDIPQKDIAKINILCEAGILRELASKVRFNPDVQGDLYLAYYIEKYKSNFEEIIEEYLNNFSNTVFTNLSYALSYNRSDTLQSYLKSIINRWETNKDYSNRKLEAIYKIVYFAPLESFIYLQNSTKNLPSKENRHRTSNSGLSDLFYKIGPSTGDFNQDDEAINMGSIEPIISELIMMLKNDIPCDELEIKHIIQYLVSKEVLSQEKPYFDNQTVESIFEKLVSPLDTLNFDVILNSLQIMENWIIENPLNNKKINILSKSLKNLLRGTFDSSYSDGFSYHLGKEELNISHSKIRKILHKAKSILINMLENQNLQIKYDGLNIIQSIGGLHFEQLSRDSQVYYKHIRVEVLNKLLEILQETDNISLISQIESIAINTLNFNEEKDEAIKILSLIPRTDEYLLYQLIKGVDFFIINFDKFYDEYKKQTNIKDWMFDSIYRKDKMCFDDEQIQIIQNLSNSYSDVYKLIDLLNSLNMNDWNSSSTLLNALNKWFEFRNEIFIELYKKEFDDIKEEVTINVLKEFYLINGLKPINVDDIIETLTNDELIIYIYSTFKNDKTSNVEILNKIISLVESKTKEEIRKFISIISQKIYFYMHNSFESFKEYEHIIIKFLDWQLLYKFELDHYVLFICEKCLDNNIEFDAIKEKLKLSISDNDIHIRKHELKKIYNILGFGLSEVLENLYNKLISKDTNGRYNHAFFQYFDYDKIEEVLVIKSYIKSYDDLIFLMDKSLHYYNSFTEYFEGTNDNQKELKIDLEYFLKYAITKEYLERYFEKLISENDIEKIIILYKMIPANSEYTDLIVQILNILKDKVDSEDLLNYLTQVGKIKSYSSSPLQNSPQLLNEESFLKQIKEKIQSLSLQCKIKEELKYIELKKREEIERDIEHLLDK